ncbi:hypothetical protein BACSTE_00169 [Bacteroides stercoris ATCC 43183]|uniref:Uncharacterized protein n=1 Tax=Bacteroides stercoris ATCC 43183 TaxID=449673 RepID=B0NL35_BACSE|nr:hypothetical protein BACSTE_00169 [Bacteroides stercoris ATCC 43183]
MCCALFWFNTLCICFKCDRNPATWGTYLDILFLPTVEDKKGASLSGCP